MILETSVPWKIVAAVLAVAVVVTAVVLWKVTPGGPRPLEVHYPYWCKDCKAVFDVQELKKDPKAWRIAPGGPSDSVVICPKCNKGWAYPVATCPKCHKKYVLHLAGDGRCPRCHPENAEAARKKGVNLTPPEIDR